MALFSRLFENNLRNRLPFLRSASAADRRYQRSRCYVISTMSMMNRPLICDGVVDSISAQGMQFRPASSYILDRRGDMVGIDINYKTYYGTIVAVRASGYGIALSDPIPEGEIAILLEEYGYKDVA